MTPKPKLLYLTWNYPYAPAEAPFVKAELHALPEAFDLRLFACADEGLPLDAPMDCPVPFAPAPRGKKAAAALAALLDKNLWAELWAAKKGVSPGVFSRRAGYLFWSYVHAHAFYRGLRAYCQKESFVPDIGCSFWGRPSAYALLLLKKDFPQMKAASRFHGCDLYAARGTEDLLPFRKALGTGLDRLLFISEQGKRYWEENCPVKDASRLDVRLLGSAPAEDLPREAAEGELTLCSCSTLQPVKRVERIADALSGLPESARVRWIHIGGGPGLDALKVYAEEKLAKKPNVRFAFTDTLPNGEIVPLYRSENAGLFLNVSSSEGLPVSMMEALSAGVPLMGTDVGGVRELILPSGGVLLPADPAPREIAAAIAAFAALPKTERSALSRRARALWEEKYDAEKNAAALKALFLEMAAKARE